MFRLSSIYFLFLILFSTRAFSIGILDEISQNTTVSDLITENILAISPSKRIFLISNENRTFTKGDYISLVFNSELTARALVAKTSQEGAGIKILKIYKWQKWQQLAKGIPVQIIRGDDSYFKNMNKKKEELSEDELPKISSDDDLYNSTEILGEDLEENNKSSNIRQDNLLGVSYGVYPVKGSTEDLSLNIFSVNYDYQIGVNFWLSASFGIGTLQKYPTVDLNTNLTALSIRGQYLYKIPFHSYIAPYIGFNYQMASSPKAGSDNGTNTQEERDLEISKVDSLTNGQIAFGAKLVRHLAPGWYAMLGVGNDIYQVGVAIEF